MEQRELLAMISVARQELSEAERELDQALGEIRVALRAEKRAVPSVVEDAFAKLRRAKSRLTELENGLFSGED